MKEGGGGGLGPRLSSALCIGPGDVIALRDLLVNQSVFLSSHGVVELGGCVSLVFTVHM